MRLIDADALVRTMDDYVTAHNALRDVERVDGVLIAKSFADEQPTVDAVPVVRCKNCKHRTELCGDGWHPCTDMAVNNNWYCADGESKE